MSWALLESDPAVFTDLLSSFGVKGLQLEEVYSLDDISPQTFGLFFLFKWKKGRAPDPVTGSDDPDAPIFLQQVIPNACGTIALLHVLLNCPGLEIGEVLSNFRDFVRFLPSEDRGTALGSCDPIRIAHNSYARPEIFMSEDRDADEDDDAFHFVAYTAVGDRVFEFDGLQNGPRLLGSVAPGEPWAPLVQRHLEGRIREYSESEIRFNLLALVKSRVQAAEEHVVSVFQRLQRAYAALEAAGAVGDAAPPEAVAVGAGVDVAALSPALPLVAGNAGGALPAASDASSLVREYESLQSAIAQAAAVVESEKAQRAQWSAENDRRRHNFVPLIMEIMSQLAQRDKLLPLLEAGTERAREERTKALARRRAEAAAAAGAKA